MDLIQSMMNSQDQEVVQAQAMIKSQTQMLVTIKVNHHMKVDNPTKINKTLN